MSFFFYFTVNDSVVFILNLKPYVLRETWTSSQRKNLQELSLSLNGCVQIFHNPDDPTTSSLNSATVSTQWSVAMAMICSNEARASSPIET